MQKIVIIAEAGVNHNGSLENAKKLIDAAAVAKADYVKFQTFRSDKLVSKTAAKAEYQKINTGNNESQLQMLKKLELSTEDHHELLNHCRKSGINFLSTAFDLDSIDFIKSLNVQIGKIPSGEITNLPYLRKMASSFPKLILSTGMADIEEIGAAVNVLVENGASRGNITILHCNTEYPTSMPDVNLKAMQHIKEHFQCEVGYSDHTLGIEVPVAAAALGARIIEKHFTLNKCWEGPDHKASLDPQELQAMVHAIRNIEQALGKAVKMPTTSELKNKSIARKSIVTARRIMAGETIKESDLIMKRPGTGISPMELGNILGKKAKETLEEDTLLQYTHVE